MNLQFIRWTSIFAAMQLLFRIRLATTRTYVETSVLGNLRRKGGDLGATENCKANCAGKSDWTMKRECEGNELCQPVAINHPHGDSSGGTPAVAVPEIVGSASIVKMQNNNKKPAVFELKVTCFETSERPS